MDRTAADGALLAITRMVMDASVRTADDLGGLSMVHVVAPRRDEETRRGGAARRALITRRGTLPE